MIDDDLDFCDQQIEAQNEKIKAIASALKQVNKDIKDVDSIISNAKEERNRVVRMQGQLLHKLGGEKCKLGEMESHRKQLKLLKTIQKKQNQMIDEQKDKQ